MSEQWSVGLYPKVSGPLSGIWMSMYRWWLSSGDSSGVRPATVSILMNM